MASIVTYKYIKQNPDIMEYIRRADKALEALGYTEHSFAHVERVAATSSLILSTLGYDERTVELARVASIMHDIGNVINRVDHAQSGAVMAFRLLDNLSMPANEICSVISAIGNHDEGTGQPLDPISAALIIGDKTDVRRSRVRHTDFLTFDIHDRVNYAVEESRIRFNEDNTSIILELRIDTEISPVMEYFEIFMERMILCRRASEFLKVNFEMIINGSKIL
ncbi:MAG: HD domain-containing protein [Ruminococcus sp.]|uniref:HD domain-containing protein n=1 Tax=uncultured Ruminococcus sp. TaxID=165186 RepID=UPI001567B9EA|nr:HD domain-containing protein [uncultured Ruminococcus sp.]MCR4862138.1 HD domain-containing protein [Ruminococcus sp.]